MAGVIPYGNRIVAVSERENNALVLVSLRYLPRLAIGTSLFFIAQ